MVAFVINKHVFKKKKHKIVIISQENECLTLNKSHCTRIIIKSNGYTTMSLGNLAKYKLTVSSIFNKCVIKNVAHWTFRPVSKSVR